MFSWIYFSSSKEFNFLQADIKTINENCQIIVLEQAGLWNEFIRHLHLEGLADVCIQEIRVTKMYFTIFSVKFSTLHLLFDSFILFSYGWITPAYVLAYTCILSHVILIYITSYWLSVLPQLNICTFNLLHNLFQPTARYWFYWLYIKQTKVHCSYL